MATPHRCPVCSGTTKRPDGEPCTACKEGLVWEPQETEQSAQSPRLDDPTDLTYRP